MIGKTEGKKMIFSYYGNQGKRDFMEGDLFCGVGCCSEIKEDQDCDVIDLATKMS